MVRHTKRQVLGGEEVLQLPPKTEELVEVVLTAEEQEAYKKVRLGAGHGAGKRARGQELMNSWAEWGPWQSAFPPLSSSFLSSQAHEASKALFAQYRGLGNAQINKHLLQIMALLLPMRRVCSGAC